MRPVQWLVALFGGEVVPLHVGGPDRRPHRAAATASCRARLGRDRERRRVRRGAARARTSIVDPRGAQRPRCSPSSTRLESETGLRVRPDDALLAEVINLGEYPVGVSGSFDPAFLEVPEEIIVTAMRTHQRYFAMEDAPASSPIGSRR